MNANMLGFDPATDPKVSYLKPEWRSAVKKQDDHDPAAIEAAIRAWCIEHLGQELEVTNQIDPDMEVLYSDRAVGVEPNQGNLLGVHEYASCAVELPERLADLVRQYARLNIDEEDLDGEGLVDHLHITVKYGLEDDAVPSLVKALQAAGPVWAQLGELRIFPADDEHGDVLYAAVDSSDLAALNQAVCSGMPHSDTQPSYEPHLTLAYLKPGAGTRYAGMWLFAGESMEFLAVVFQDRLGKKTMIPLGEQVEKFDPSQPRVPAGGPEGGQWTGEGGGAGGGVAGMEAGLKGQGRLDKTFSDSIQTRPSDKLKAIVAAGLAKDLRDNEGFQKEADKFWDPGSATEEDRARTREEYAGSLVSGWAETSGDNQPEALALQMAAAKEFDTPTVDYLQEAISWTGAEKVYSERAAGLRAFARATYERTQVHLKEAGIDNVLVFRGVAEMQVGSGFRELKLSPLSSFTTDYYAARAFATKHGGVVAMVVPRQQIFSTPLTGIGCRHEKEVVIIGKAGTKGFAVGGPVKYDINDRSTFLEAMRSAAKESVKKQDEVRVLELDRDDDAADWLKRTWDLPATNPEELLAWLKGRGTTVAEFKRLPVFRFNVEKLPWLKEL